MNSSVEMWWKLVYEEGVCEFLDGVQMVLSALQSGAFWTKKRCTGF